jgi:hypothetical protein
VAPCRHIADIVRETVTGVVRSKRLIVQDARRLAVDNSMTPPLDSRCSLVALPPEDHRDGEVCFVLWQSANMRLGRRVGLDRRNRIKGMVYFRVPVDDFSNARMVVTNVPLDMKKATDVPEWLLLLKTLEEVMMFSGPFVVRTTEEEQCEVCRAELARANAESSSASSSSALVALPCAAPAAVVDEALPSHTKCFEGFGCSGCTLRWHSICAKSWNASIPLPKSHAERFLCPVCFGLVD